MRRFPRLATLRRWLVQGLADQTGPALAKLGLGPNFYTLMGFLLSLASGVVLALGHLALGGGLLLLGSGFDFLDGVVARATGRGSRFGAFLDSTLDRLGEGAVLVGLLVFYAVPGRVMENALIGATLVGSLLVSYMRARGEGLGLECEVGFFTRVERVLVLGIGLLAGQVLVALWIVALASYFTAAHRFLHIWKHSGKENPGPSKAAPQRDAHSASTAPRR